MKRAISTFCFYLLLAVSPLPAADGTAAAVEENTFTSAPFAFHIGAPVSWKLVPSDFPVEEYEFHGKKASEVVANHGQLPIVRIVKPAGDRTISPAVQVFVVSDKGEAAKDLLLETSKKAAQAFEDYRVIQEPKETILNGTKAVMIETTFTVTYAGGRRFPTLSRVWAVPRDKMIFVISITGEPEDLKALSGDIDIILKTIRFTDK